MIVVDTEFYSSFKQKEHIISMIKKKFNEVRVTFTENLVIYQYDDGIKQ